MFRRIAPFRALAGLAVFASVAAYAQTTTTSVSATPSTVTVGQSSSFSATVTSSDNTTPTGQVNFYLNNQNIGSGQLSSGSASYTESTTGLAPATYQVFAYYTGDYTHPPSTSATINFVVNAASKGSTTTVLTAPSQVTAGKTATISAAITGTSGQPITGTVSFYISGNLIGTANVSGGSASLTGPATGVADGTYPVTAHYNGDSNNSPSGSAPVNVTISGSTATTLTVNPSTVTIGLSATLTATVTTDSSHPPTGTVKFVTNGITIGSATVTSGTASLSANSAGLPPGTYTVTATYQGDAYNAASSGSVKATLTTAATPFSISPAGAAIASGGTAQFGINPNPGSAVTWSVDGIAGGNSTVGTISSNGLYTAPATTASGTVQISAVEQANPHGTSSSVPVYVVVPGAVSNSNNKQVASYAINAPVGGQFSVEFGLTTSYGRATWQQPTTGASQTMLVAGMSAPATYHMRGDLTFPGGIVYHDADKTFATTPEITTINPAPVVTQTSGLSPQPGIELVNLIDGVVLGYNLDGTNNYGLPLPGDASTNDYWNPVQLMPNGHLLGIASSLPVGVTVKAGSTAAAYEMLLDGTIVRELTLSTLQSNLAASGYRDSEGNVPVLQEMHHDIVVNPNNGHWIFLTNADRVYASVEGETGSQTVLGDIVMDVDPNNNFAVDWVWNEFDHLDINRHPYGYPDWTHSNAVVYVPGDHNILVSSRHQSWVMKVDYEDGAGDGTLLWRLGYQGDFTLENGTDPTDWQYAQHGPSFTTASTSGVFGLTLMDNGDDRVFPSGVTCSTSGGTPPCFYSRAPVFTIDENAMTARLDAVMPNENYSFFGGNAEQLGNGDEHVDYCDAAQPNSVTSAVVDEFTPDESPTLVWSMTLANTFSAYRSKRLTSFYPGVTWTK